MGNAGAAHLIRSFGDDSSPDSEGFRPYLASELSRIPAIAALWRPHSTADLPNGLRDAVSVRRFERLYPTIEETARRWQAGVSSILGAVMAHEIGHLLLDSHAHGSSGIMSASFGHIQIKQAGKGELLFTTDQTARFRSQVALRQRTSSSFHSSSNPSEPHDESTY